MENKKEDKKDSKDAVDIRIVKTKKSKIFSLDDITTGYDEQIGFGIQDRYSLMEELPEEMENEKKKLAKGLNMKDGRDVIIFLRRLTQCDTAMYIKVLEDRLLGVYDEIKFLDTLYGSVTTLLNDYREIFDRLPEKIKAVAVKGTDFDMIRSLKKDLKKHMKPESREKLIAKRLTPEQMKHAKIIYFEQDWPESFTKELEKTEKMTDDEYVAYQEQERKKDIKII